jgi:hypothetical protein
MLTEDEIEELAAEEAKKDDRRKLRAAFGIEKPAPKTPQWIVDACCAVAVGLALALWSFTPATKNPCADPVDLKACLGPTSFGSGAPVPAN